MLDAKFFLKVGPIVRDRYRKHIFTDAKDIYDKPFKGYSKEYGTAKRANTFKRQSSQYSNSLAPVLTSDLLRDYSLIKTSSSGFQIGWSTYGARVEQLNKRGRVLTTSDQPMPKKVLDYLFKQAHTYIGKESGKITGAGKTKIHRIGKK